MRRATVVVLAAVVFFVPAARADIVLDACIGGIGVWDTSSQVLAQWGEPVRKTRHGPDRRWHYPTGSVLLTPWSPSRTIVLALETRDPRERTPAGIGVGSTLRRVRAAYPHRSCPRTGRCEIGRRSNRSTTLRLRDGRVVAVGISLYSDYDDGPLKRVDARCR